MSTLAITRTPDHPASQNLANARGLTIDEVIPHLVGHTIDEVERELILHTLIHCCGSRTRSANILGISIRCMRNKIHEYEDLGIAVRAPGEPRGATELFQNCNAVTPPLIFKSRRSDAGLNTVGRRATHKRM